MRPIVTQMKNITTLLLVCVVFTFTSIGQINKVKQESASGKGWIEKVQQNITEMEYFVSYDEGFDRYQSPNRVQDIRSYYSPGLWQLQNRIDSAGDNWKLCIRNQGVYADGVFFNRKVESKTTITENKIQFRRGDYTEEYINSAEGVRQNYIIHSAPEETKEIRVSFIAKGLKVHQEIENELVFSRGEELLLAYTDLNVWDANNNKLKARIDYRGNNAWEIVVDVLGGSYPITIDPVIDSRNPKNAHTALESNQYNALFGFSVSDAGDVNGDGYDDVIVGAYKFDKGQTDEGASFVFYGSNTGITSTIGAFLEQNQGNASFGYSVSGAGDVNNDGFDDVIVGSYRHDNGESDEGVAFIFHGSKLGISTTADTLMEPNQRTSYFGCSVSDAGDVNGDGFDDVIVGAYLHGDDYREGGAFVYYGSKSGITKVAFTHLEYNQKNAFMGRSVSGAGDVNGDGYDDIIVGAWGFDDGENQEGAAFVYHGSKSGVSKTVNSLLQSNQASAFLGWSVSNAGDVNGDGFDDVIVGAHNYDKGQVDEGVAFVFHGSKSGVGLKWNSVLESNQASGNMGYSVSGAGDFNGDGFDDVIVGAYKFDKGQTDEGAAYIFHGSKVGMRLVPSSTLESDQASALFGSSVSSAGDVNKDGYSDIIVGAPQYDKGSVYEGVAFVFHGCRSCASSSSKIKVEVCSTYLSPSGKNWNRTGIYQDTVLNYFGWDSLITVDLVVNKSSMSTINPKVCNSYTSPSGKIWTKSATYLDTIPNVNKCDSLMTINLTVNTFSTETITEVACNSYTSPSGKVWAVSNTYKDTIPNARNCDSFMTINLTVNTSSSETISEVTCSSYTSPSGKVWTTSGSYLDTIPNVNSCDSLMTINLRVNTFSTEIINEVVCNSYTSPSGKVLINSGTYLDTIPNVNNCDSFITINLKVNTFSTEAIAEVACNSYISPSGKTWTTNGIYYDTIPNYYSCDSLITINLTVNELDTTVTSSWLGFESNENLGTYQWLDCGNNYAVITKETSRNFRPLQNGDYAVWVTANNGCRDTSACYNFSTVGVKDLEIKISAIPNPTTGSIEVRLGKEISGSAIVRNVLGQEIQMVHVHHTNVFQIDLVGPKGFYFIELRTEEGDSYILKVIKQ